MTYGTAVVETGEILTAASRSWVRVVSPRLALLAVSITVDNVHQQGI